MWDAAVNSHRLRLELATGMRGELVSGCRASGRQKAGPGAPDQGLQGQTEASGEGQGETRAGGHASYGREVSFKRGVDLTKIRVGEKSTGGSREKEGECRAEEDR